MSFRDTILRGASTLVVCALTCASSPAEGRGARAALTLKGAAKRRPPLTLQLRAERLRYLPCVRRARGQGACKARLELRGKVSLSSLRLSLVAQQLRATLGPKGQLVSLVADGGVTVTVGSRRGEAARATLDARRRIVLSGNARLYCPKLKLSLRGRRIVVDLEGKELVVDAARAKLEVPRGRAR